MLVIASYFYAPYYFKLLFYRLSFSFKSADIAFFSPTLFPAFLLPDLLASHFSIGWLSWLGLGSQGGSTTDHLQLFLTQHVEWSKYNEGRLSTPWENTCWIIKNTHSMRPCYWKSRCFGVSKNTKIKIIHVDPKNYQAFSNFSVFSLIILRTLQSKNGLPDEAIFGSTWKI